MKFTMKKMVATLALAGFATVASAAGGVGTVTEIRITGGDFAMGPGSGAACGANGPFGNWQCLTGGSANPINTVDGLFEGPSLTAFNFFGAPVTTFTAPGAAGAAPSTSGNPIQGSATASTITLDLGSFYANWSGSNFLQAPGNSAGALNPLVSGSYISATGAFDLSWSSYITTAPFAGSTGNWHITGIATAVPEPSTYGMMLAGLGLLGGMVARRRKPMA